MFAEQILRMVAGLLVGIWVARYLGPEQFGVFSYAIAFAALFGSIAKLGLDSIVVRDLVREPNQRDVYMGTAFWLKMIGAVAMLAIMALAVRLTSSDATTNLYIFIIASGSLFQSFEVIDFYFQSKVISRFVSICKLVQLFISSLLKLYLIYIQADLTSFVLVSLVDQITLALSLFLAYRSQKISNFYSYFDLTIAKKLFRDSWPLIVSGLVIMIYMRIDQVMIKEMLGDKEVGLYSAATRISEVWYFIPVVLTNSLFPAIINAKQLNVELYSSRLQKLFNFLVWISIAIALPMTFLSDWLMTLLYGEAFGDAGQVLVIHIWSGIFVSLGVASGSWYVNEDLQKHAFYRTAFGAIVNIILNLILIPVYGVVGAAVATVIAQSMAALFFDVFNGKTRVIFFMKLKTFYFPNLFQRI